ncbi:hypothetical protein [Aeromonas hydrophila]|uniref:hypothetical protein n=1 Tax=Aeromonas hydrophila TaxID=644 RepID=UPI00188EFF8D|nr:hypothetical protein [Aeromonas hydrophila]MBF4801476.1 hypothetical protein [Aeromonas hydrophila]
MHELRLARAAFTRYSSPLLSTSAALEQLSPRLAEVVGRQIADCLTGYDGPLPDRHFLCSTIMDSPFANRLIDWHQLQQLMRHYTDTVPDTLVNAYECASWGYCLRQALMDPQPASRVMITIVDLNLMDLSFWRHSPSWGASGFGIATLFFNAGPGAMQYLNVGVAKSANFIAEFSIAVRNCLEDKTECKLALPFFPEQVTQLFQRLLPQADALPDLHPLLGHCFGADPWISLIEHAKNALEGQRFLATSVALNGYWVIADVCLESDGVYRFTEGA